MECTGLQAFVHRAGIVRPLFSEWPRLLALGRKKPKHPANSGCALSVGPASRRSSTAYSPENTQAVEAGKGQQEFVPLSFLLWFTVTAKIL